MVYLELYLLKNACMDAGLLFLSAKWRGGRASPGRIAAGALLGAAGAALSAGYGGWLTSPWVQAPLAAAMVRLALGKVPAREVAGGTGAMLCCALLALGACRAGLSPLLSGLAAGFGAAALARRAASPPPRRLHVRIRLGARAVSLEGLVDTGNLARDGRTGLPAILVPAGALPGTGDGLLRIRTAAGERLLPRMRPDLLLLNGHPVDAVVAAAPPGLLDRALIPACLARSALERTGTSCEKP